MDRLSIIAPMIWAAVLLGVITTLLPTLPSSSRRAQSKDADWTAALVWTVLTIGIAVPLAVSLDAFNWLTSLIITMIWPVVDWAYRHQGRIAPAVSGIGRTWMLKLANEGRGARISLAMLSRLWPLLLAAVPLALTRFESRLPVVTDFDILSNTQGLLTNVLLFDPLASLTALVTHASATSPLVALHAVRAGSAAAIAVVLGTALRRRGQPWAGGVVAVVTMLALPLLSASAWFVLLLALVLARFLEGWIRQRRTEHGWHAAATVALLVAVLVPGLAATQPTLLAFGPRYLETRAAASQAILLGRPTDESVLIVAPPEQRVQLSSPDQHFDLATFVDRFERRAADPHFRFPLAARKLYVFVELESGALPALHAGTRFLSEQPAAYRVSSERWRLQQAARRLCDEYRLTHAGARIVYDDGALQIHEILV